MNDPAVQKGVDLSRFSVNDNPVPVNWRGKVIRVKKLIDPPSVVEAVDTIVQMCIDGENGAVMPEIEEYAIRATIISMYTDILLPENAEDCYRLIFLTDLYESVVKNTSKPQIDSIRDSVNRWLSNIMTANAWRSSVWQNNKASSKEIHTS